MKKALKLFAIEMHYRLKARIHEIIFPKLIEFVSDESRTRVKTLKKF